MDGKHTEEDFAANDIHMFRESLIGYKHSKDSSQKILLEEVHKEFTIRIVHFISFNEVSEDSYVLHVKNNGNGDTQVNLPAKNFVTLYKYMETFRY